jgi:AraC-like DNA-binding protein
MEQNALTTQSLAPREQYEAWRERFRPVLDVMPNREADERFLAENQLWRLGELAVSRVSAPAARVERTKANIRRDPIDHWVLTYCSRGATTIRTDKVWLQAGAGVPFLWSLGETVQSRRTAVEKLSIYMPRDAFREVAPLFDRARGSVIGTPLGHLLGDYVLALKRRLPALTADDVPRLTVAVRGMLAACIAPSVERVVLASDQIDLGRLERVRQVVRRHLRSRALTPKLLSRLVGISRSNLYRLLEGAGGVAQYILHQRLLEAHAALCDPALTKSISAIAEEFCFADPSSFSRSFRHEFGQSPSEFRLAAIVGQVQPVLVPKQPGSKAAGFGKLLRGT